MIEYGDATLLQMFDGNKAAHCGGTLISQSHVITAAHCLCFESKAPYERCSKLSPMYKKCSYYDGGFIIDEQTLYLIMYDLYHDP